MMFLVFFDFFSFSNSWRGFLLCALFSFTIAQINFCRHSNRLFPINICYQILFGSFRILSMMLAVVSACLAKDSKCLGVVQVVTSHYQFQDQESKTMKVNKFLSSTSSQSRGQTWEEGWCRQAWWICCGWRRIAEWGTTSGTAGLPTNSESNQILHNWVTFEEMLCIRNINEFSILD